MIDLAPYSDAMRVRVIDITVTQQKRLVPIVDRAIAEVRRGSCALPAALEEIHDATCADVNSKDPGDVMAHALAAMLWYGMALQGIDERAVTAATLLAQAWQEWGAKVPALACVTLSFVS